MDGDIVLVPTPLTGTIAGLPKIGPKPIAHPTIGGSCLLCQELFETNDYTTLLPLGPGANIKARSLCRAEEPYEGVSVEVHWTCATGLPDVEIIQP